MINVQKSDGLLNAIDLKKGENKALYAVFYAILLIMALFCLVPVIWVFLTAFKSPQEMYSLNPTFFPSTMKFSAVTDAINAVKFDTAFLNTLAIVVGALLTDIILNGIAGYVLSRIKPKGSALLETILFWTMMMPGLSMVPLYLTFIDFPIFHFNLSGTFLPMWMMAGCSAFNIFLFRNFFNGIPMSYIEAARLDGCSNLKIFFRIMVPLSKPIIVTISIFSVIGSWSNFMWPYLMLGDTPYEPIAVLLYRVSTSSFQDNQVLMIMMLAIIPPMIMYIFLSKHIMGGVNMSGIKG